MKRTKLSAASSPDCPRVTAHEALINPARPAPARQWTYTPGRSASNASMTLSALATPSGGGAEKSVRGTLRKRRPLASASACSSSTWYSGQGRLAFLDGGSRSGRSDSTAVTPASRSAAKVVASSAGCSPRASMPDSTHAKFRILPRSDGLFTMSRSYRSQPVHPPRASWPPPSTSAWKTVDATWQKRRRYRPLACLSERGFSHSRGPRIASS